MIITPAILKGSHEEVVHALFMLEGVSERVQIDLCDGSFGVEKTWLPFKEKHLPHGFRYEFDLMVHDWRKYLPRVLALGSQRIVFHVDDWSEDDIAEMVGIVQGYFVYVGFAVSNDKNVPQFVRKVHFLESLYTKIFIQVMGISRIGIQGQPFDETCLRRISYVHDHCRNVEIYVDGSMNPETISRVRDAGASGAIVGSYIFKHGAKEKDVRKAYEGLVHDFS